ncbi:MAG: ABC transporter substrate-binding protein [Planctomycetes bacterium]|nr:ABC transporter substrate-binding protein [Planctomycetota bacterium]
MSRRPVSRRPALLLFVVAAACSPPAIDPAATRPDSPPKRIIAASIFATEVLLDIAPRERIAAVHFLAAEPRYSLVADRVRGLALVGADPEQLIAGAPDLVVVDAYTRPETVALLHWAGVPVLQPAEPRDFAGIAANIRALGRACHLEAEAEVLVARMDERLAALADRAADAGEWHVCSLDGDLHTYGRGSLADAMLRAAGAKNLAAERGAGPYRRLTVETILAWRPDGLLVAGERRPDGGPPAWLGQVPGLDLLDCSRRDRFLFVPGAMLVTTSHRLVDTAELVQDQLRRWGRS